MHDNSVMQFTKLIIVAIITRVVDSSLNERPVFSVDWIFVKDCSHGNSDRYYFVLDNRILVQMGLSHIQPNKQTEINNLLINNFSPNFRLQYSLRVNNPLLFWER